MTRTLKSLQEVTGYTINYRSLKTLEDTIIKKYPKVFSERLTFSTEKNQGSTAIVVEKLEISESFD